MTEQPPTVDPNEVEPQDEEELNEFLLNVAIEEDLRDDWEDDEDEV